MRTGRCEILGIQLMEGTFRSPAHPEGMSLVGNFAFVREQDGQQVTCGKTTFAAPPTIDGWPRKVYEAYTALLEALEEAYVNDSGVFTPETIHAVPERVEGSGLPEEF